MCNEAEGMRPPMCLTGTPITRKCQVTRKESMPYLLVTVSLGQSTLNLLQLKEEMRQVRVGLGQVVEP